MSNLALPDGWECRAFGLAEDSFPCSADPILAVSLGLAAGGVARIFTIFLMNRVSRDSDFFVFHFFVLDTTLPNGSTDFQFNSSHDD